jgi:hypothetical protein
MMVSNEGGGISDAGMVRVCAIIGSIFLGYVKTFAAAIGVLPAGRIV